MFDTAQPATMGWKQPLSSEANHSVSTQHARNDLLDIGKACIAARFTLEVVDDCCQVLELLATTLLGAVVQVRLVCREAFMVSRMFGRLPSRH
jgi:hypothetical protein